MINTGTNPIQIHFDTRANTDVITYRHYITLTAQGDSYGFDVKTKSVWISMSSSVQNGEFALGAEETSIQASDMFIHSGSGINSVGP